MGLVNHEIPCDLLWKISFAPVASLSKEQGKHSPVGLVPPLSGVPGSNWEVHNYD